MPPEPTVVHPLPAHDRVVFLKPLVSSPKIVVGEYTYYDDPGTTRRTSSPATCSTATVRSDSSSASTARSPRARRSSWPAPSTRRWVCPRSRSRCSAATGPSRLSTSSPRCPARGDTVVGNDVWFGYRATVMPGVRIGTAPSSRPAPWSPPTSAVHDRRRQSGQADPATLRRRRHRTAAPRRVVGLACRTRHRTCPHDHEPEHRPTSPVSRRTTAWRSPCDEGVVTGVTVVRRLVWNAAVLSSGRLTSSKEAAPGGLTFRWKPVTTFSGLIVSRSGRSTTFSGLDVVVGGRPGRPTVAGRRLEGA